MLKQLIVLMCSLKKKKTNEAKSTRPGDWLENSPILTIIVVVLGLIWMFLNSQKQSHHCHFKSQHLQLRVFNAWVSFTWHTTKLLKCCRKSSSSRIRNFNSVSTLRKYCIYYDASFKQSGFITITLRCRVFRFNRIKRNLCDCNGVTLRYLDSLYRQVVENGLLKPHMLCKQQMI